MRILLATSELHPFSKTGGLADMVGALAKALDGAGHQVGVVTPLYRGIRGRFPEIKRFDWHLEVSLGARRVSAGVWTEDISERSRIYFIDCPEFFDRLSPYAQGGVDYPDNAERFIFFSKSVVHLARYLPWAPEVVHANDWQTGLVPILIKHLGLQEGWSNRPRTCFTIHNLAYQGVFPAAKYELTNLPVDYFNPNGVEFYLQMNCLKAGIAYGDVITTVSPRYAREISTPEYGCGLDGLLRKRQSSLFGILNGVDYDEWNTTRNHYLRHEYSARNLAGKVQTKLDLQAEFGLPVDEKIPLFGTITRLADQKGVDIQFGALEEMLSSRLQFVLLGSGGANYEAAYRELARRHPTKAGIRIGFDQGLSHRIEAGCDFYLMPSRFEPCGLNQMYSLRYGTVPIVRRTGGLDDTVVDISDDADKANGIKFSEYSARALAKSIRKALVLYETPKLLRQYRLNGMKADFSWQSIVKQYAQAYGAVAVR